MIEQTAKISWTESLTREIVNSPIGDTDLLALGFRQSHRVRDQAAGVKLDPQVRDMPGHLDERLRRVTPAT